MAFLLRRTLLAKCIPFIRNPRYISNHSQLAHALTCEFDTGAPLLSLKGGIVCTGFDPFWAIRRGFAEGRKSKDESSSATIQVVPDIGPTVKSNTLSLMEAAIAALSRELSKIRTGRASTGMLDHIIVDAHGVKLPLNRVAVVSAVDARTLSVTPHDPNKRVMSPNLIWMNAPLVIRECTKLKIQSSPFIFGKGSFLCRPLLYSFFGQEACAEGFWLLFPLFFGDSSCAL